MRHFLLLLFLSLSFSHAEKRNVLLLCVDDLRPELNCYGVDYIHSPNIDALAEKSLLFKRHYVQAPSCGPSRYSLLTGLYGVGYASDNGALNVRGKSLRKDPKAAPPSLPNWFKNHGYMTVAIGKVSHEVGGYGGKNWADESLPEMPYSWDKSSMPVGPWKHPMGTMHALADGEIREKAGDMDAIQSFNGSDTSYPDGLITESALREMEELRKGGDPFFLAVGFIRPHLPFGAPAQYMEHYKDVTLPPIPHPDKPQGSTTWHGSGEFRKQYNHHGKDPNTNAEYATDVRKHYAACISYVDAQVGQLMKKLEELDLMENTVIVLWGDHGWHLGEHGIWGKHSLFEESLLSPLMISSPGMEKAGESSAFIAETIDIFPTLCELTDLPVPDYLEGESLLPVLNAPELSHGVALSHSVKPGKDGKKSGKITMRDAAARFVWHSNGHTELYDHNSPEKETKNIAKEHPDIVDSLKEVIMEKVPDLGF